MVCAGRLFLGNCAVRRTFWIVGAIRLLAQRPRRLVDCSLAASLPKRSAVVTRRFEPAMARVLAGFGKVSTSDAVLNARLCLLRKKVLHAVRFTHQL